MNSPQSFNLHEQNDQTCPINWSGKIIDVVSLGCGNPSYSACQAFAAAQVIISSEQQFTCFTKSKNYRYFRISTILRDFLAPNKIIIDFPKPFSNLAPLLQNHTKRKIVILASGDALFYGAGTWLTRIIGAQNLRFHPAISSMQACFHALKMPWRNAQIISLHGRPLHTLRRHLHHNILLGIFTDDTCHPAAIAHELVSLGLGQSMVWVCEAMGCDEECVTAIKADQLANQSAKFHPLNICIIKVIGHPPSLPAFPGIADHLFHTGAEPGFGMISKRETRLLILSLMQPGAGEIAWDIGAGCGSVSVEWARWNHQGEIYAIEKNHERIAHIESNSKQFGTSLNVKTITGTAPQCCESLPPPDCIFIGGSGNLQVMLDFAWQKLRPGGKLVASAITADSQTALQEFIKTRPQPEWVELNVEKNLPNSMTNRKLESVVLGKCVKDET